VGTVEYRSVTDPIRQANQKIDFCYATATGVNFDRKTVTCKAELDGEESFEVPYDFLVLSIGMHVNTFNTPGVKEHCFFLKELDDARNLRAGIVQRFEAANLPGLSEAKIRQILTFVVVGGGPSGVEMSGELFDFIQQDLSKYFLRLMPYVRKVLLHSGKMVLEPFDRSMREFAMESMKNIGIDLLMESRVMEVTDTEIVFQKTIGTEKVVERIPYGLCLWAAGNAPRALARKVIEQVQPNIASKGKILTDAWMRVVGVADGTVFAVGDCSEMETGALPQTAMVASQQGEYVARLINSVATPYPTRIQLGTEGAIASYGLQVASKLTTAAGEGSTVAQAVLENRMALAPPFQLVYLGILAYLGDSKALAQVKVGLNSVAGQGAPVDVLSQGGWVSWLIWRSVYIVKQVSLRNRVSFDFWFGHHDHTSNINKCRKCLFTYELPCHEVLCSLSVLCWKSVSFCEF
jgi:NADH dehydrogenase FAD-containing subunit